jgi:two-component system, OmpR family, copper resistance phosphate regulon response regulator CusR
LSFLPNSLVDRHEGIEIAKSDGLRSRLSTGSAGSNRRQKILFVEDDSSLSGFLCSELQSQGFLVDRLRESGEVFERLEGSARYDLLVLELNSTGIDGITLLKKLRPALPKLPILVVSPKSRVEDKVQALQSGADDYMTKPLSPAEFFARIGALLRRNSGHPPSELTVADLTLNHSEHWVERNGRRISLTPREFDILDLMMQSAGRPISRAALLERVWNVSPQTATNVVDVYVKYVRDKVDRPGERKLIHTVRGFGYELRPN